MTLILGKDISHVKNGDEIFSEAVKIRYLLKNYFFIHKNYYYLFGAI